MQSFLSPALIATWRREISRIGASISRMMNFSRFLTLKDAIMPRTPWPGWFVWNIEKKEKKKEKRKSNKPQLLESWVARLRLNQFYLTRLQNSLEENSYGEASGEFLLLFRMDVKMIFVTYHFKKQNQELWRYIFLHHSSLLNIQMSAKFTLHWANLVQIFWLNPTQADFFFLLLNFSLFIHCTQKRAIKSTSDSRDVSLLQWSSGRLKHKVQKSALTNQIIKKKRNASLVVFFAPRFCCYRHRFPTSNSKMCRETGRCKPVPHVGSLAENISVVSLSGAPLPRQWPPWNFNSCLFLVGVFFRGCPEAKTFLLFPSSKDIKMAYLSRAKRLQNILRWIFVFWSSTSSRQILWLIYHNIWAWNKCI